MADFPAFLLSFFPAALFVPTSQKRAIPAARGKRCDAKRPEKKLSWQEKTAKASSSVAIYDTSIHPRPKLSIGARGPPTHIRRGRRAADGTVR